MTDLEILTGDSLIVLPTREANSFDSCVTDPPYELTSARPGGRSEATRGKVMGGFMGMKWDGSGIAFNVDLWIEVYRVLKPGAYLLAFGGTRTYHRMVCAIEDAGFEIRDQIQWLYGSGFPKSLDVSKAIDKMHGAEREQLPNPLAGQQTAAVGTHTYSDFNGKRTIAPLAVTDDAKQWDGWGTALKPANEPICLARKPLEKGLTVAQNVLKWGTGAINIDGCRIETNGEDRSARYNGKAPLGEGNNIKFGKREDVWDAPAGRFPANVIHDGSDQVLEHFPHTSSGSKEEHHVRHYSSTDHIYGKYSKDSIVSHGDEGSASRFFYCAKADKSDRHSNGNNNHPTVKPVELMQYLCRLVTPPNGLILDPFLGSGSTAKAALIERFRVVGIEMNSEYAAIADARCRELQVNLFDAAPD